MTVIGITGPTGAGKTTVLNVLEEMGGAAADCDQVYHGLLRTSAPLQAELRARFGGKIFAENGGLRRKELGALVFEDPQALADLNAVTHRHIIAELKRLIERARAGNRPAIALDAIALIESGAAELCDVTIAVTAPEDVRVGRIMAREGISEAYARARVRAQKPGSWFEEHCTYTLRNDGDRAGFEARARSLLTQILD